MDSGQETWEEAAHNGHASPPAAGASDVNEAEQEQDNESNESERRMSSETYLAVEDDVRHAVEMTLPSLVLMSLRTLRFVLARILEMQNVMRDEGPRVQLRCRNVPSATPSSPVGSPVVRDQRHQGTNTARMKAKNDSIEMWKETQGAAAQSIDASSPVMRMSSRFGVGRYSGGKYSPAEADGLGDPDSAGSYDADPGKSSSATSISVFVSISSTPCPSSVVGSIVRSWTHTEDEVAKKRKHYHGQRAGNRGRSSAKHRHITTCGEDGQPLRACPFLIAEYSKPYHNENEDVKKEIAVVRGYKLGRTSAEYSYTPPAARKGSRRPVAEREDKASGKDSCQQALKWVLKGARQTRRQNEARHEK
ncbi:hypothetical protein C8R45DRAFT_948457 [Mycena sanguinolenta]|nr:hypothetical protein C8R45DRAFT_948457 [Mycena sanguinolenta]